MFSSFVNLAETCKLGRAAKMLFAVLIAGVAGVGGGLSSVHANELGGNTGYQFITPSDRSVAIGAADLMGKYGGGYYQQWQNNYTYNTYNSTSSVINGNQVNCSLSSSATGNSGSTSGYASTASPSVSSTPSVSSYAAGNQASGSTAGSTGTLAAPLNSVQGAYGSPVGSAVTGTVSSAGVGQLNSGFSSSTQALNTNQSATNSPATSAVANSSACSGSGIGAGAVSSWK